MMGKTITILGAILFVLALPPALSLSNFRWFAFEARNYAQGQASHRVSDSTGLSGGELLAIDRALVRYFGSGRDGLAAALQAEGVTRSPFSERDVAHLRDVHDLIALVLRIHWVAAIVTVAFLIVTVAMGRRRLLARGLVAGGVLTLAVFGMLGILSLLDWDAVFLRFHFLSFSNDLWRLDPVRDALIRLYPPGFFLDSLIRLVAMSVVEALALLGLGALLLRSNNKRRVMVT